MRVFAGGCGGVVRAEKKIPQLFYALVKIFWGKKFSKNKAESGHKFYAHLMPALMPTLKNLLFRPYFEVFGHMGIRF